MDYSVVFINNHIKRKKEYHEMINYVRKMADYLEKRLNKKHSYLNIVKNFERIKT